MPLSQEAVTKGAMGKAIEKVTLGMVKTNFPVTCHRTDLNYSNCFTFPLGLPNYSCAYNFLVYLWWFRERSARSNCGNLHARWICRHLWFYIRNGIELSGMALLPASTDLPGFVYCTCFEFCVLGSQIIPLRKLGAIDFKSLWNKPKSPRRQTFAVLS